LTTIVRRRRGSVEAPPMRTKGPGPNSRCRLPAGSKLRVPRRTAFDGVLNTDVVSGPTGRGILDTAPPGAGLKGELMITADAILLTLRAHGPVRGRTKLLRRVAELPIDAPIVHGEYGPYPENGFDALELLDNLMYISVQKCGRGHQYDISAFGEAFVCDKLAGDVTPEEWTMIRKPLK